MAILTGITITVMDIMESTDTPIKQRDIMSKNKVYLIILMIVIIYTKS